MWEWLKSWLWSPINIIYALYEVYNIQSRVIPQLTIEYPILTDSSSESEAKSFCTSSDSDDSLLYPPPDMDHMNPEEYKTLVQWYLNPRKSDRSLYEDAYFSSGW